MGIGSHQIEFEVLEGWGKMPDGWSFVEVAGVAVDSQDRVYLFVRGASQPEQGNDAVGRHHPVIVFDKEGKFLNAWGEAIFTLPHGIFIDHEDNVYLVDCGDHTIRRFDTEGNLQQTIGEPGKASDTGFASLVSPVCYSGGPFNRVANMATSPNGDIFVADGYGNARVHRFSRDGTLKFSWGHPGNGPGQFNLPHGIAIDSQGLIYIADRENSRIQVFDENGAYRKQWDWVNRPTDLFIDEHDNIYIAELGHLIYQAGYFRNGTLPVHYRYMTHLPEGHTPIARVSVCDPDGMIIAQFGGPEALLPGNFIAPHGIWVDSAGDMYVGEIVERWGAVQHFTPMTCHSFQKFQRRAG